MPRVAFLTCAAPGPLPDYDGVAVDALRRSGVPAERVVWSEDHDWSHYDLVVVRSAWDYHTRLESFLRTLEAIDRATLLANPLRCIEQYCSKSYLLSERFADVPKPRTWKADDLADLRRISRRHPEVDSFVVKPLLGASAEGVHLVQQPHLCAISRRHDIAQAPRPWLVQEYLGSITSSGEHSIVFLDGVFSHAVRKQPARGDFRTQEELGATVDRCEPPPGAVETALAVLRRACRNTLYARIDLVRHQEEWCLFEIELVEPSLYFLGDEALGERFARAILDWSRRHAEQ